MERGIKQLAELVWKWLKPQLPERPPQPQGGRPWEDDKACLLGICWVLKTGGRWKDIPPSVGVSYVTCWRRHRDWTGEGLFDAAWAAASAELNRRRPVAGREGIVDGSFVRAKKGATTWVKPRSARA
jgi:transposase